MVGVSGGFLRYTEACSPGSSMYYRRADARKYHPGLGLFGADGKEFKFNMVDNHV